MDSEYNGDVPELANHITQRVADKDTNILFHNKHFIKKIHWMVVSTASSIFSYELRGGERGSSRVLPWGTWLVAGRKICNKRCTWVRHFAVRNLLKGLKTSITSVTSITIPVFMVLNSVRDV